jgi:hypothetical protein
MITFVEIAHLPPGSTLYDLIAWDRGALLPYLRRSFRALRVEAQQICESDRDFSGSQRHAGIGAHLL